MIILETDRLIIRNWRDADRDMFFEINSNETVMTFFPFRRNRIDSDAFFDHVQTTIRETGLGFYAVESKASGEPIGFCGLARTELEPFMPRGTVEIGWRLAPRSWGKGLVSEAATALLRHGFEKFDLPEIVSFAVHDNHRSTSVMQRIGMHRDSGGDFDHPRVPDDLPHLKRHVLFRLTAGQWREAVRPAP